LKNNDIAISDNYIKDVKRHRKIINLNPSNLIIHIILLLFALMCIIPLLAIVSMSLSRDVDLNNLGFSIIPLHFDLTAYRYVLSDPTLIINSYKVSILVTVVGTILSLFATSGIAYVLSRPDYRYRNKLSFYVFFTLLFNGGLVPWYMLIVNYLHLLNTIWALILPYLVSAWFILLLRTFLQKLPFDIIESCYIDGANEYTIFFKIVLPLSTPGIATIGLFIVLTYWNDWWLGLLFIEQQHLVPLQLLLYRELANINYLTSSIAIPGFLKVSNLPTESARMAMAILAAGPIMFVFPFFQKYFVKGLTVGSVKG
jgi:putative aldouronate transport system permease protein